MTTHTVQNSKQIKQGFEANNMKLPNAATRNVDLMADEMAVYGYVTPELWAMVLDEESTHAAEILATQEMAYAAVPRIYRREGEDLVDIHNQSLTRVLRGGISSIQEEQRLGVPGSGWELRRRQAELKNLQTIISMPGGTVCAEISASPFDKPKHEQLAQHYTDLTVIRLSFKDRDDQVTQYNYVLPVSSPEFLYAVQSKFGRKPQERLIDSEELLKNPIIEKIDQPLELAAKEFDNLIGAALLEVSVGQSAVRMIKRAIEDRREAWQFVVSKTNSDIHQELRAAMQRAACLRPTERSQAMNAIRSGFWKELKDRFRGNKIAVQEGGIIMAAAARAVAAGDVFIACGSTVVATEFVTGANGNSAMSRSEIVKTLRENVTGSGSCAACAAKGKLFGCGLCGSCNKKWCDIYERTGKQTEIKNLAYFNYSRPTDNTGESFEEYWERISREIKQKQQRKKLKEAETIRLKKRKKLAESA